MNSDFKAQSCTRVFVLLGMSPCQTKDLLKQTECERTVSRNLLYFWHKHFTVNNLFLSKMKEAGWLKIITEGFRLATSVRISKECCASNSWRNIVEV